jgi:hypothetical protein
MDSLSSTSRGASLKESVIDRGVTQTEILGTVCPGFFLSFLSLFIRTKVPGSSIFSSFFGPIP